MIVLLATLALAIQDEPPAPKLRKPKEEKDRKVVALTDVRDKASVGEFDLAGGLGEALIEALTDAKQFRVADRRKPPPPGAVVDPAALVVTLAVANFGVRGKPGKSSEATVDVRVVDTGSGAVVHRETWQGGAAAKDGDDAAALASRCMRACVLKGLDALLDACGANPGLACAGCKAELRTDKACAKCEKCAKCDGCKKR